MFLLSVFKDKSKLPILTSKDIIVLTCFFLSGFTGLVYEICWIKKASLVFGTTAFAVSTVVATFFAGLALGSYMFGRSAQNVLRPLKLYALLQICLGCFALINPALFYWAENLYGFFYSSLINSFVLLSLSRLVLVSLLILPPAVLMGASLPLFCRQYVMTERRISFSVGLLYALNTLGAVAGCTVCGFYLIPCIGINRTIWFAALMNIMIGSITWLIRPRKVSLPDTDTQARVHHEQTCVSSIPSSLSTHTVARHTFAIYILFFLSGLVAMGNEILWVRYLSLIVHNTVYTYTLTLTIILIGIVLGSIVASCLTDRMFRRALFFGSVHIISGIMVLTLLMQPAAWWQGVIDTQDFSTHFWIFMLVLLLPAVLSGLSFPLAIRMVLRQPSLASVSVGKMVAINTVGGIVGSLFIGFGTLPLLGLQKSLLLTTGISMLIGIAALLVLERTVRLFYRTIIVSMSLLIWVSIPLLIGTRLPVDFLAERGKLVDFREGLNSNLAVIKEDTTLILTIDRMEQGSNHKSPQIMGAHVPMLVHQSPKNILVIGLGTGQTARRFLMYDIAQLHCVDIERELFELVRKHYESSWMEDERVRLIVEDGRNYITHTRNKYDVISIEVGQIFRPGLASFYTADFYLDALGQLNKNGIVCQSVPVSFLGLNEFRSIIRSFLEVFPESILWYNTVEFLLIGSAGDPLTLSSKRLDMLTSDTGINEDLNFAYWGGRAHWLNRLEVFVSGFLCASESLAKLCADAPIYWDDLPRLEYVVTANLTMFEKPVIDLVQAYNDHPYLILNEKLTEEILSKIQSIRENNLRDVIADFLYRSYSHRNDIELLEEAIQWNPYNVRINIELANALINLGRTDKAINYYEAALNTEWENSQAHTNLGYVLAKQGKLEDASIHLKEAVRIDPNNYRAHNNLAIVLYRLGTTEQAFEHWSEATRLNPKLNKVIKGYLADHTSAKRDMGEALLRQGKFTEASRHYREVLRIEPNDVDAHNSLGIALAEMGNLDEAVIHFTTALQIKPEFLDARSNLGRVLALQDKATEAVKHFYEVLRSTPCSPRVLSSLAWILATTDDVKIRNPKNAVRFAAKACELTDYKHPIILDTLAVAYAADGKFPEAVSTAEKALKLAQSSGQDELAKQIQNRLLLFNSSHPYTKSPKEDFSY